MRRQGAVEERESDIGGLSLPESISEGIRRSRTVSMYRACSILRGDDWSTPDNVVGFVKQASYGTADKVDEGMAFTIRQGAITSSMALRLITVLEGLSFKGGKCKEVRDVS